MESKMAIWQTAASSATIIGIFVQLMWVGRWARQWVERGGKGRVVRYFRDNVVMALPMAIGLIVLDAAIAEGGLTSAAVLSSVANAVLLSSFANLVLYAPYFIWVARRRNSRDQA